jgi:hypothetical protein
MYIPFFETALLSALISTVIKVFVMNPKRIEHGLVPGLIEPLFEIDQASSREFRSQHRFIAVEIPSFEAALS